MTWQFPACWKYVRLHPGLKHPTEEDWQHNPREFYQTSDRHRGIHVGASRLLVLDEDVTGDLQRWLTHLSLDAPRTFEIQTASGKKQYYYNLPDYVPTEGVSSRIRVDGFGIDLLAGMRCVPTVGAHIVDLKKPPRWQGMRAYTIAAANPIATAPDWLVNKVPIRATGTRGTTEQLQLLYGKLDDPDGKPCAWMQAVVDDWVAKIKEAGKRLEKDERTGQWSAGHCHEEGLHAAWAVAHDGAKGHRGAYTAMQMVKEAWISVRQPSVGTAENDWDRIADGSWAKAANENFDSFFEVCFCSRDVTDYYVPPEAMPTVAAEVDASWQQPQRPLEPVRVGKEHYAAPLEALPDLMRNFVLNASRHSQTVPEMALFGALCSISFATGGNLLIDIDGHYEPVTLWAVLTALASQRKSGALTAAVRGPLAQAIRDYWSGIAQEQIKIKDEMTIIEKRIKKLRDEIAGGTSDSTDLAYAELERKHEEYAVLKSRVKPKPIWDVTDTTVEGIEQAMESTGGPIASFADEAALLSTVAGRYAGGKSKITLSTLNSAHGRAPINTVRAGQTRYVEHPHLVLCQLIQPKPFGDIMSSLGEVEDGFLSRWLYSDPAPYGPRRARTVRPDAADWTNEMWSLTLTDVLTEFWGRSEPKRMTLSPEAWRHYEHVFPFTDLDSRSYEQINGAFSQWMGKATNAHIVRVAVMFQLVMNPKSDVLSGEAMARAVHLFGWLRAEAFKVMRTLSDERLRADIEQDALCWFATKRSKDRSAGKSVTEIISARTLKRGPSRFRKMATEDIEAILIKLAEQHWLEEKEDRRTGDLKWVIRPDFEDKWAELG
jgi:hypothetical protein